jgi:methyltransferase (TIGR00027 family)
VEANHISKTALASAYIRGYHAAHDHPKIFDDSLAHILTPAEARQFMEDLFVDGLRAQAPELSASCPDRASALAVSMQASAAPPLILGRSRYAEDILGKVVEQGVQQYVIIGAGMDSFALRRSDSLGHLRVFEVDGPAIQGLKQHLILAAGREKPPHLHFVPLDFTRERLAVGLAGAGHDPRAPSFFSLLGVTFYLSRRDLLDTLSAIADVAPAGSSVAFDYLDTDAFVPERVAGRVQVLMDDLRALGEPWITGLAPASLAAELAPLGLRLQEDLGPADVEARYFLGRQDQYHACEHAHLAWSVTS